MDDVSEASSCIGRRHIVGIAQAVVYGTFHLIARACGAVVIEEIIAVDTVFRPIVFLQLIYQFLFFFRSQVQGLFPDVAVVQQVFRKKVFVFRCSKPVVRFAKSETKDEVRRLKTEQTVVEYHIDALPTVS